LQCFGFQEQVIVIKKNDIVGFSEPSPPIHRMDPGLLNHWASNLKTLLEWEEAFLVFK
jgi:hypothetical protein